MFLTSGVGVTHSPNHSTKELSVTTAITSERLHTMFRPRNVALVGASNKSMFSLQVFDNLQRFGAADRTFLVNRRGVQTHGTSTFTSCSAIGQDIDLAYLMVPRAGTVEALREAHAAGVQNAVVLSSGYGEAGPAGRSAQAELLATADELDMLLLGPNMLGFANFIDDLPVTSVPVKRPQRRGQVALLSQSGASSSAMSDFARFAGIDLTYMVTLGNEAMVTAGHVLDFLVDDESTKAVAIFLESIRDAEAFTRAARRAAAAGKAVVVLKAGASELSARTAAAHTGALVGDDRVVDALFRELGVIRVDSIEDMLQTADAAATLGPLPQPGIAIASISGGACDIIADRAEELGASLPTLAPQTVSRVQEFFADYGTVQNPLDVTGAAIIDPTIFTRSIAALADDPSVGVVGVVSGYPWEGDPATYPGRSLLAAIGLGAQDAAVRTVLINQVQQPTTDVSRAALHEAGITTTIAGLNAAMIALQRIAAWSVRRLEVTAPISRTPPPVPAVAERRGEWSEERTRQLLDGADVPVVPARLAKTVEEATAVGGFRGPFAVKVVSPDILHKSDIGGVRLNVPREGLAAAFEGVIAAGAGVQGARVEGALIAPMRSPATELLVGVVRDASFGLVLAVALGGVFVEVLQDSVLMPLPVTPERASALLDQLKASAVLDGFRGGPAADRAALGQVISRIGDLALALGEEMVSLEVNPLRVDGSQIEALDAVVEWRDLP